MPRMVGQKRKFSSSDGSAKRFKSMPRRSLSRAIRAALPEEVKYYDIGTAAGTPDALTANTLKVYPLSAVGQGNNDATRIGSRAMPKYIDIRWSCYQASTSTNANIRVLLVMDTENQGSSITTTQLLEAANVLSATATENKARFKVLRDECIQVNNVNSDTVAALPRWYVDLEKVVNKQYSRPMDKMMTFNDTTAGASTTLGKNALFLCVIADTGVTATYATGTGRSGFEYYSRLAFTDA